MILTSVIHCLTQYKIGHFEWKHLSHPWSNPGEYPDLQSWRVWETLNIRRPSTLPTRGLNQGERRIAQCVPCWSGLDSLHGLCVGNRATRVVCWVHTVLTLRRIAFTQVSVGVTPQTCALSERICHLEGEARICAQSSWQWAEKPQAEVHVQAVHVSLVQLVCFNHMWIFSYLISVNLLIFNHCESSPRSYFHLDVAIGR